MTQALPDHSEMRPSRWEAGWETGWEREGVTGTENEWKCRKYEYTRQDSTIAYHHRTYMYVPSTIYHLPSTTCHLLPAIYQLPPATCHLPPTTYHLPPTIAGARYGSATAVERYAIDSARQPASPAVASVIALKEYEMSESK